MACEFTPGNAQRIEELLSKGLTPNSFVKQAYKYLSSMYPNMDPAEYADTLFEQFEADIFQKYQDKIMEDESIIDRLLDGFNVEKFNEILQKEHEKRISSISTEEPVNRRTESDQEDSEQPEVVRQVTIEDDGSISYIRPFYKDWGARRDTLYLDMLKRFYRTFPGKGGKMNRDFRRRFYNYVLFNPQVGTIYDRSTAAQRIESFREILIQDLTGRKDDIDILQKIRGNEELVEALSRNPALQDTYDILVMNQNFDSLVYHNYRKIFEFNEDQENWEITEQEKTVRQGYNTNDNMEQAFTTMMSVTMTHLEAVPLVVWNEEKGYYETQDSFISKYKVYRFIDQYLKGVNPDEDSIRDKIDELRHTNEDGGVAAALYVRFFADDIDFDGRPEPMKVFDGKGVENHYSLTHIAKMDMESDLQEELEKSEGYKRRAENILSNLISSLITSHKHRYVSVEGGKQNVPTHGTATASQLKAYAKRYLSERKDRYTSGLDVNWDNKHGKGTIKFFGKVLNIEKTESYRLPVKISPNQKLTSSEYRNLLSNFGIDVNNMGISNFTETFIRENDTEYLDRLIASAAFIMHANNLSKVSNPEKFLGQVFDSKFIGTVIGQVGEVESELIYTPIKWSPSDILYPEFDYLADFVDKQYDIEQPDITKNVANDMITTYGPSSPEYKMPYRIQRMKEDGTASMSVFADNAFVTGQYSLTSNAFYNLDGYEGKSHKKLTDKEGFEFDFLGLFGRSVVDSGFKTAKVNYLVFSDKSMIPVAEVNRQGSYLPVKDGKLDTEDLFLEYKNSVAKYYENVEAKMLEAWKRVAKTLPDQYENSNILVARNSQELYEAVENAEIEYEDILSTELVNNYDYINRGGFVGIRSDLNEIIKIHKDNQRLNDFLVYQRKEFIENITKKERVIPGHPKGKNLNFNLNNSDYKDINEAIAKRFTDNSKEWSKGTIVSENGDINPLVEGYFWHHITLAHNLSTIGHGNVFQYKGGGIEVLPQYDKTDPRDTAGVILAKRLASLDINENTEKDDDSILDMRSDKIEYTSKQEDALKKVSKIIKANKEDYFLLAGYAGTGKTTITENIVNYATRKGKHVFVTAPTNKAVEVLESKMGNKVDSNVVFETIYKTLKYMKFDNPNIPDFFEGADLSDSLIIIDESSMINDDVMKALIENVTSTTQVVFLGDSFQLPPIGGDPDLFTWTSNKFRPENKVELTEVKRQVVDSGILTIATAMRTAREAVIPPGNSISGDFRILEPEELQSSWLNEVEEGNDTVILTYTNNKRTEFNQAARQRKFQARSKNHMLASDKMIAVANTPYYTNGQIFDLEKDAVMVGNPIKVKLFNDRNYLMKEPTTLQKGYFTRKVKVDDEEVEQIVPFIFSPDLKKASLSMYDLNGLSRVRGNQKLESWLNEPSWSDTMTKMTEDRKNVLTTQVLTYGYSITTHKSQGSQWKSVYVNPENNTDPRWMYTAVTRASDSVAINRVNSAQTLTWDRLKDIAAEGAQLEKQQTTKATEVKAKEKSPITHVMEVSEEEQAAVTSGQKTLIIRHSNKDIGIPSGQTGIVEIGGKLYAVTHEGLKLAKETGRDPKELGEALGTPLSVGGSNPANPLLDAGIKPEDAYGHAAKDIEMAGLSTQFVGEGISRLKTSTEEYKKAWGDRANTGKYSADDIVMISANVPRKNKITIDQIESKFNTFYKPLLEKIVKEQSTIVVGDAKGGDQLVRKFLIDNGYLAYASGNEEFEFFIHPEQNEMSSAPIIKMGSDNIRKIKSGEKTTTIRSASQAKTIGIDSGQSRVVKIGEEYYRVTNRGEMTVEEAGGRESMIESEAFDMNDDGSPKTKYKQTQKWLNGQGKLYVYDINPYEGPIPTINRKDVIPQKIKNTVASTWISNKEKMHVYSLQPYTENIFKKTNSISRADYFNKLNQQISESYLDQSKRASLGTSTYYQPMLASLDSRGKVNEPTRNLPEKSKIIYFNDIETGQISDPSDIQTNDLVNRRILSNGKPLDQEIYDGAFFILPIELIKILNSYGGDYSQLNSEILKDITTDYDDIRGVVKHEKKATYQITNELVKLSRGNNRFDFEKMVIKMLSDPAVTFEPRTLRMPDGSQLEGVTNMLQVFEYLGGFDSDTSWHNMVEVEYLNPEIANMYIGKIGINTSVKTGSTKTNGNIYQVINSDTPLVVSEVRNDYGGIQLNPDHDPSNLKNNLSVVTQMIKSAVLEGKSSDDAHAILEAFEILTDYKLSKHILENEEFQGDLKNFVMRIMKDSIQSLEFYDSFIEKINDDSYDLSFNDRMVLKKMYQQVTSVVSKIGIKHKFKGGQFTVTPVTNIVMLYDVQTPSGIIPMTSTAREMYRLKNGLSNEDMMKISSGPRNLKWLQYYHNTETDANGNPLSLEYTEEWKNLRETYDALNKDNTFQNRQAYQLALTAYYNLLDSGEWSGEPAEVLLPNIFKKDFGINEGDTLSDFLLFDENLPQTNRIYERLLKNMQSDRKKKMDKAYRKYESLLQEAQDETGRSQQDLTYNDPKILEAFENYTSIRGESEEFILTPEIQRELVQRTVEKIEELKDGLSGLVARIPGSGKQSWNAFKVVGFMNSLSNSIGMPVESMVVKGEDFDIDKGNVQLFEFMGTKNNKLNGYKFPWFTKLETGEVLKNSSEGTLMTKDEVMEYIPQMLQGEDLEQFNAMIEAYPESSMSDWYESGLKNFVTAKLKKIGLDGRNAIEVNTPVSTAFLKNRSDKAPKMWMTPWNPVSVPLLKNEQMMGKGMVGFEANALKSYATIFHAAKMYGKSKTPYSLDFSFRFFSNLQDTEFEFKEYDSIANTEQMGALIEQAWTHYSELINSATDNAKLLILGKLNINENTSNMLNALISIGVPFNIILDYMNNPYVTRLIDFSLDYGLTLTEDDIASEIEIIREEAGVDMSEIDEMVLDRFMSVYQLGQEFALMAQFLGLNKGLPSDPYRFNQFEYVVRRGVSGIETKLKKAGVEKPEFDIVRFATDVQYREYTAKIYENAKIAINIPGMIASNPDIMSQLKSYAVSREIIYQVSPISNLSDNLYNTGNFRLSGGRLEQRHTAATNFAYKFVVDQYLQNLDKIKVGPSYYDLSNLKQRTKFIKDFPAYINHLKKKNSNEFLGSLIEEDIKIPNTDYKTRIIRMVDTRAMHEDMKAELRAAFAGLRDLNDGDEIINALHIYSLILNGGSLNSFSFTQFFDNKTQRTYNDFLNSVNINIQDLDNESLVKGMVESNPGLFKEYETTYDEKGKETSGYDNMINEIKSRIQDNNEKTSSLFYAKVKINNKYKYYKIFTQGPELYSDNIRVMKFEDPASILTTPYTFQENGDIKDSNIDFVLENKEQIGPRKYKPVKGRSLFDMYLKKLRTYPESEDPFIRNNLKRVDDDDNPTGQEILFENTFEGFENKYLVSAMDDSVESPTIYVSTNPDNVNAKNNQIRRLLFEDRRKNMFNKGERIVTRYGNTGVITAVESAVKPIMFGDTQINMEGYKLSILNRRDKIFVPTPKSYLANASRINSTRNRLTNEDDVDGLRVFNKQLSVFGEDIMYGYAVTPEFLTESDSVFFDEVSLMKNENIRERNEIYEKIFMKTKNRLVVRSNRFFKNLERVDKATMQKYDIYINNKLQGNILTEVANNFVAAINDAEIDVEAEIIKKSDLADRGFDQVFKDKKSFVVNNKIYIIRENISLDTPIHEFSHIWTRAMKKSDPELHKKIVKRMLSHPEADKVRERYPELSDNEDLLGEEILSTLISKRAIMDSNLPTQGDYNEYLNWVNEQLVDIFANSEFRNISDLPIGYLAYKIISTTKDPQFFNIGDENSKLLEDYYGLYKLDKKLEDLKSKMISEGELRIICKSN